MKQKIKFFFFLFELLLLLLLVLLLFGLIMEAVVMTQNIGNVYIAIGAVSPPLRTGENAEFFFGARRGRRIG